MFDEREGRDDGAQCQGDVHLAVETDVAHAAAVRAAGDGFEFIDDLHGADFGGTADGANGQRCGEGIPAILIAAKDAGDGAGKMHDVAVTLDFKHAWERDGAWLGDAAYVVATEIDEHDVFGAFFGVGAKFVLESSVFRRCFAAAARAGEGAIGEDELAIVAFAHAAENFGTTRDENAAIGLHVDHVGTGVDGAQGAVDIEGIGGALAFEALT